MQTDSHDARMSFRLYYVHSLLFTSHTKLKVARAGDVSETLTAAAHFPSMDGLEGRVADGRPYLDLQTRHVPLVCAVAV